MKNENKCLPISLSMPFYLYGRDYSCTDCRHRKETSRVAKLILLYLKPWNTRFHTLSFWFPFCISFLCSYLYLLYSYLYNYIWFYVFLLLYLCLHFCICICISYSYFVFVVFVVLYLYWFCIGIFVFLIFHCIFVFIFLYLYFFICIFSNFMLIFLYILRQASNVQDWW